ncbi:MAG TPA: MaoC family dehydratase [Dehalococcoidia bacterium]|nr:MaoC family dehydratase [Dehalococcoidia bacterium]
MTEKLTFNSVQVGDKLPTVVRPITQEIIWKNAVASLDYNPVHIDPEWVKGAQPFGIPVTVCHGMMTLSYMATVVSDWCYNVMGSIRMMEGKLVKPVPAGSTTTCTGVVTEKHVISPGNNYVVVELNATNQDGDTVAVADVEVVLPDK